MLAKQRFQSSKELYLYKLRGSRTTSRYVEINPSRPDIEIGTLTASTAGSLRAKGHPEQLIHRIKFGCKTQSSNQLESAGFQVVHTLLETHFEWLLDAHKNHQLRNDSTQTPLSAFCEKSTITIVDCSIWTFAFRTLMLQFDRGFSWERGF